MTQDTCSSSDVCVSNCSSLELLVVASYTSSWSLSLSLTKSSYVMLSGSVLCTPNKRAQSSSSSAHLSASICALPYMSARVRT